MSEPPLPPEARVEPRGRFSAIWLVPLIAAAIAGWLGWQTLANRGPLITLELSSAQGLTPGQTQVRHKAVPLGTVESVRLSDDLTHAIASIRMTREAEPVLTDHARFWVVLPRLTLRAISGLETLVSGPYIELDPGGAGGRPQRHFIALEEPPAVRSGVPGRTVRLRAERLGTLGTGSPVLFRDAEVGEVLGYELPKDGRGPVIVSAFIRAPQDALIGPETRFWSASGVQLNFGPQGIGLQIESVRALFTGGIAFADFGGAGPAAEDGEKEGFTLYKSEEEARGATYRESIAAVTYLDTEARGLGPGAPVEMLGIRVGTVTDVGLTPDVAAGVRPRVRVRFQVQPERVFGRGPPPGGAVPDADAKLVAAGLRAAPRSANLITGQQLLSLEFVPNAPPAELGREGEVLVVPAAPGPGDLADTIAALGAKLNALPLDEIGRQLVRTLTAAEDTLRDAQRDMRPALAELPRTLATLQATLADATRLINSLNRGYGADSAFRLDAQRTLQEADDALRAVRLLADFLTRHPEALIRGRASPQ
ncbi:MAG TPA: MlaD family protein [Crenalkalicoccus sp.]|nr:MlaD family protein [Crenalkalicoccus sp.]